MPEMNALNPALANLLQVASMVTPEQTPTVAAQVATAAQGIMSPQGGGMQGVPGMPGMNAAVQNAQLGNQVQMHQQQQEQQGMQDMLRQMLQQRQSQDNAMRFGVAAAPGAQTIRMAEGGIVGYADAGEALDTRKIPETVEEARRLKEARERAQRGINWKEGVEATQRAASKAAKGTPIGRLLGLASLAGAAGAGASDEATEMLEGAYPIPARIGRALMEQLYPSSPPVTPYDDIARLERRPPAPTVPAAAPAAPAVPPPAPPAPPASRAAPAAPAAGIATLPAAQQAGPSQVDAMIGRAMGEIQGMETAPPTPEAIGQRARADATMTNEFLRSQGVNPQQIQEDLRRTEERERRKLQGLGELEARVKESRTGIDGLIRLLSAGGGRTDPLAAIGRQYGANVAQDLAEDERFMRAREAVMDSGDAMRMALREKQRAEAMGNLDRARTAEAELQKARNMQRKATAEAAIEAAKLLGRREEVSIDAATKMAVAQMQASAQRAATEATREGTSEIRRNSQLISVQADLSKNINEVRKLYQKQVDNIALTPGLSPKDLANKQAELRIELDNSISKLEKEAADLRAQIMGAANFSVRPVPQGKT